MFRNCDFRQLADSTCIYVNKITHEINEITNINTDVIQVGANQTFLIKSFKSTEEQQFYAEILT